VVRDISWIMSLTGPTLIAIDQIDAIVSESNVRIEPADVSAEGVREAQSIIEGLSQGLMDLHEVTQRSVTIVSCLDATWQVLKHRASVPVTDRYSPPDLLKAITDAEARRELVAARLRRGYETSGFQPPYETWPFTTEAFDTAAGFYPRQLLKACEEHRRACLAANVVTECSSFRPAATPVSVAPPAATADAPDAPF